MSAWHSLRTARHQRRRRRHPRRLLARSLVLGLTLLTAGCLLVACGPSTHSTLNPNGPVASKIATLTWVLLAIAAAVFVVVVAFLLVGALHTPRSGPEGTVPRAGNGGGHRAIAVGAIILPALILIGVFGYTLSDMVALSKPTRPAKLTIQVIGHQWWWEVHYPGQNVVTANEIHVPVGEPVTFNLTTADVIHSFWVPSLIDKRDLIPGHTNSLWLEAKTAGTYRGQCAEFCGQQHAHMAFLIIAQPPDQFATWLKNQAQTPPAPTDGLLVAGEQAFLGSACVYCHTVKGTDASGKIGPDLTHIGSRQTLAAGTLPNTPGNLAGWIVNPQQIKPGNKMPAMRLTSAQLQAIVAYLESLK